MNNHKLSTLAKHFCIVQNNYHNALEDAFVCGKIFYELFDLYQTNYSKPSRQESRIHNRVSIPIRILSSPYLSIVSEIFLGKKIVVSGVFYNFSRDEIVQVIVNNGGNVTTSISAKTSFIVAGDNMGPSKLEKALQLKVPIISEEDFLRMIAN